MFKFTTHYFTRLGPVRTFRFFSSNSAPAVAANVNKNVLDSQLNDDIKIDAPNENGEHVTKSTGLVAAAFASLNADNNLESAVKGLALEPQKGLYSYSDIKKQVDEQISKASTVENLLSLVDHFNVTRKQSLMIVSTLSDWAASKRIQLSDFESDARFLTLCNTLGRQRTNVGKFKVNSIQQSSEDLNIILGVAGDDEAARLISNLKLSQMIKVMSSLAQKKRRSIPLLRALSYHITKDSETLDLKKCADIFYAMASLNFLDAVLIDRICSDIQETLPQNNDKSAVIGSIATSLGLLKYKDTEILNTFTDWMVKNSKTTRPQDIMSLVMTMAIVGYKCNNSSQLLKVTQSDIIRQSTWLDYVWSLVVLDLASNEDVVSVFDTKFIASLRNADGDIPVSCVKKLLNINACVTLLKTGYMGPFLGDDIPKDISLAYSKEKVLLVTSLLETLKSLLSSESNLKKNCNSRMGFLYDAECLLDSKCNPYPVDLQQKPKGKRLTRVAMLALEYHDICKQTSDPIGSIVLYKKLLEAQGYRVLFIPYTEFNPRDKLVNRVQYIENKFKQIVQEASTLH